MGNDQQRYTAKNQTGAESGYYPSAFIGMQLTRQYRYISPDKCHEEGCPQ